MNRRFRQDERKPFIIANHRIRANELRVLSDTGEQLGVMQKNQAQNIANEQELDLVLIVPNAEPPVAKIISLNNHGAGDYLEVAGKKKEILVPYNFDHIVSIAIQTSNHIIFFIGLLGLYFLFKEYGYNTKNILIVISFLNIIPDSIKLKLSSSNQLIVNSNFSSLISTLS